MQSRPLHSKTVDQRARHRLRTGPTKQTLKVGNTELTVVKLSPAELAKVESHHAISARQTLKIQLRSRQQDKKPYIEQIKTCTIKVPTPAPMHSKDPKLFKLKPPIPESDFAHLTIKDITHHEKGILNLHEDAKSVKQRQA